MMHDMSISAEEKKEMASASLLEGENKYPYGLRICLNPAILKKMGIGKPPEVGTEMKIEAMVEVVEVSADKKEGDVPEYRVELQITQLGVAEGEKKENNAEVFYGSK